MTEQETNLPFDENAQTLIGKKNDKVEANHSFGNVTLYQLLNNGLCPLYFTGGAFKEKERKSGPVTTPHYVW